MHLPLMLKGVVLGFVVAVPVGPIGLICIQRTLSENRASGYAAGLGAATADMIYGFVAGFGLGVIADFLLAQRFCLGLVGGLFLCVYGLHTYRARPALDEAPVRLVGLVGSYLSTLLLTLANPLNVLLFAAIFAGVGVAAQVRGLASDVFLAAGVFVGSGLWWFTLTTLVSLFRARFDVRTLRWANRISGALISAAGVLVLANLLNPYFP